MASHSTTPRSAWIVPSAALLAVLMLSALGAVLFLIDLTPRVESDFFFSTGDPAFQATARIEQLFPSRPQLLLAAVAPDIQAPEYIDTVRRLSDQLAALPGVDSLQSLTHGPANPQSAASSPIWKRLLLTEDPHTTQILAFLQADLDAAAGAELVHRVEHLVETHQRPSFQLRVSGVPYVVELIRRHLMRDLHVFSLAALLVFGLVIAVLYRSVALVAGTLLSCIGACLLTLTVLYLLGVPIGLLTANLATLVFVLTLSHTIFLTANWRRARVDLDAEAGLAEGVRITFLASFWCMVAALLGFGSLLLASAKPLRELGTSGIVGTLVAILVAYGFYPLFLRFARPPRPLREVLQPGRADAPPSPARPPGRVAAGLVVAICLLVGLGLVHTETDPSLLTYFDSQSELRRGLDFIDERGGSSPLYLVIRDPGGAKITDRAVAERLDKLQASVEKDAAVGVALSLPLLLAEARRVPFAGLLPTEQLVDILDSDRFDHIARSFVTEDRSRALLFLRMHEGNRKEERHEIVARIVARVGEAGLEAELVGGLYDLQGKLGDLVAASLVRELGGLLFFFIFVAAAVARTARGAASMVFCLALVPIFLLGGVGLLGQPIDVISAPGANVAISLGIDAMIHLVMAVRRRKAAGDDLRQAWLHAREQMRQPIVGAMVILAIGFGIFVLSSFPPTRRFGMLVAIGTLASAAMALVVLPFLATVGSGGRDVRGGETC